MGGWTQVVMGDRYVIVCGQFVLRVKFIPSSLPMAHTNMCIPV